MKFTESQLEQAFIDLLGEQDWVKQTKYIIESYEHLSSFLVNKLDFFIPLPKI